MTEWSKKRKVMHHYDRLAAIYDAQYADEQNAKIKAALNSVSLEKDSFILDAGCGTGLLFEHLLNRAELIIGLDTSSKILSKAKERVKQFPKVCVIRADADHVPVRNEVFDAVFAITLLQNMPKPVKTLHEMKRVSRRNAFIIATGLKKEFTQEAFTNLLSEAGLRIVVMKTDGQLKGYVAICRKP